MGVLRDAVSCTVTEERNGAFELEMVYPITGQHYSSLALRGLILAKPNPYGEAQYFRIYKISRPINGQVTVNAQHISCQVRRAGGQAGACQCRQVCDAAWGRCVQGEMRRRCQQRRRGELLPAGRGRGLDERQQIFGPVCGLMEGKDMENSNNTFLAAKAAIAAVCGAFTAAFGWLGWLVMAWAVCMVLDWLSGSAAAASRGEWSSAVARAGIWHKAGMLVVVVVAALTDAVLSIAVANLPGLGLTYSSLILPVVLVWYIFTELGSIAENAAEMGANVPEWLLKLLAAGKSAADKSAGGITVETGKNADGSPIGHLEATQLDELKMEDLEQLAIDMGLTVQDGAKRADLIAQISAEPVKVPNGRK